MKSLLVVPVAIVVVALGAFLTRERAATKTVPAAPTNGSAVSA